MVGKESRGAPSAVNLGEDGPHEMPGYGVDSSYVVTNGQGIGNPVSDFKHGEVLLVDSQSGGVVGKFEDDPAIVDKCASAEMLCANLDAVPSILKKNARWVVWRCAAQDGSRKKIPYVPKTPFDVKASCNDPSTWGTFGEALSVMRKGGFDGVGYVFTGDGTFTGVDLDHVLDERGILKQEYRWIVDDADTYTEVSPSGEGLHLIFSDGKPDWARRCKRRLPDGVVVEMYDDARFLTVTANLYVDAYGVVHPNVRNGREMLRRIYETYIAGDGDQKIAGPRGPVPAVQMDDDTLTKRMVSSKRGARIRALIDGDTSAYGGDESAADQALCNYLAFWCSGDEEQMDRIFRKSGLYREKWDETRGSETYGERTIRRAIEDMDDYYETSESKTGSAIEKGQDFLVDDEGNAVGPWDNPHLVPIRTGKGDITGYQAPTVPAISWWLKRDPALQGVRYDEMSGQVTVRSGLPWARDRRVWEPVDSDQLLSYMQERYKFENESVIHNDANLRKAFNTFTDDRRYDAVREMLEGLPAWDGEPRAESLLVDFLGAEDSEYTREVTLLLLRAAVKRAMEPGCKYDHMIILKGAQGIGKSTLLERLAMRREFYIDDVKGIGTKEAQEQIRGRWIVELGELSGIRNKEAETLKSFITTQTDTYRTPYDRTATQKDRRCILVGTTNRATYLDDVTGARRFLPVICGGGDVGRLFSDDIEDYIEQVWAETIHHYREDPDLSLVLPAYLADEATVRQQDAQVEDPREGLIAAYLEKKNVGERVCTSGVLVEALGVELASIKKGDNMQISEIIRNRFPDWKSGGNKLQDFDFYGRQRYFERVA